MGALTARINETEERISDTEDQMMENKEAEKKRDKYLLDHKDRIREICRSVTYNGRHIRLATDLSTETWQARKDWHDIFRALNEKNMQPRILYPARLSLKIEGEIKSFQDKQKLKEFANTKPALQEILKGVL